MSISKMFMNVLDGRITGRIPSIQSKNEYHSDLPFPFYLQRMMKDKQLIDYNWYTTSLARIRWNAGILGALRDTNALVIYQWRI